MLKGVDCDIYVERCEITMTFERCWLYMCDKMLHAWYDTIYYMCDKWTEGKDDDHVVAICYMFKCALYTT